MCPLLTGMIRRVYSYFMTHDKTYPEHGSTIPIDQGVCFSNDKGVFDERNKKEQLSYLKKLEPLLHQVLRSREKVLYVARCQWPQAVLDVLTSGWIAYFMNQAMIIVTSTRIIFLRTRSNNLPAGSLSQAEYHAIASYKRTGFGQSVELTYASGRIERFSSMQPKVSKKLIQVLETLVSSDHCAGKGERQYLCPRCSADLIKGRYACPDCNLQFKDPATAVKCALFYPGGGFFYMRRKFFGFQYALSELLLLGLLIVALVNIAQDTEFIGMAVIIGILLVITKAIHVFRARSYTGEYVLIRTDSSTMPYA